MIGYRSCRLLAVVVALCVVPRAHAQFAVIDVNAVAQLVTQIRTLEQQLSTAREHLAQAQSAYQSMTGNRGMERLLSTALRNYLPADWGALEAALRGTGVVAGFPSLGSDLQRALGHSAVLSAAQLAQLEPNTQRQLKDGRSVAALLQALSHQALAASSARFGSLQQLIAAIGSARDQKAVLDLQARIGAEQNMLQNEQTKLQVLYQAVQAEQWANQQRSQEQALAWQGQFATRFQPIP